MRLTDDEIQDVVYEPILCSWGEVRRIPIEIFYFQGGWVTSRDITIRELYDLSYKGQSWAKG